MSPGRGAEEQSGAAQQAEGEGGHHPRHGRRLPGARGRYGHPSSPHCPRVRKETLLGDFPGLWDRNLWAPQHTQAQPAPPGRLQVPHAAAAAGVGRGGCGERGEKGMSAGRGAVAALCPRCRASSLRRSGPGSVPSPQVVAPKGTRHNSAAQVWDGQSGAFPPPIKMGPKSSLPNPGLIPHHWQEE